MCLFSWIERDLYNILVCSPNAPVKSRVELSKHRLFCLVLKPNVRADLRIYCIRDPFRVNQPLLKVLKSLKCVCFFTDCRVLCVGVGGGCVLV